MAGQPFKYRGQGFSLRRDKNRFVLPNLFRGTVRESSGGQSVLCLAKHERWPCLVGYGLSRVEEFEDIIAEERQFAMQAGQPFDRDALALSLYTYHEIPFDGSGRFVLPEDLATLAGVDDQLYFQGAGQNFFVFAPNELAGLTDTFWKSSQAACVALAAKELAAKKLKEAARK
jgi:MraZ protein